MDIIIHNHNTYNTDPTVIKQLSQLLKNQEKIMATLKEISEKADQLQASLDAEQAVILEAIAGLQQTIADLQANITDGGTAEERQAVVDKLEGIKTDLEGTIA
jgi:chromosome segregation ATPase